MSIYYITFGQKSPLRNNWVEAEGSSIIYVMEQAKIAFGESGYSNVYDKDTWDEKYFPSGKVGEILKCK